MVEERDERFDYYRHRPSGLVQWHLMAVHVVRIKWDCRRMEVGVRFVLIGKINRDWWMDGWTAV